MNLPNTLTLLRIFFVPLIVAALLQDTWELTIYGVVVRHGVVALAVFLAAAATDLLDGYLARRWKQITTVGMLLDPIADKLLISAALISLVQVRAVPAWMTILVVGREFAVSGLRSIAAAEGYVIRANDFGKIKLVSQVVAVSAAMLTLHWPELQGFALAAMWVVVVSSLASAAVYFRKFWHKVDIEVKRRRRRELLETQRRERARQRAQANARAASNV